MNICVTLKSLIKTPTSKHKFYISLSDKGISNKKYQNVPILWNKFKIKTVKDYDNLYLWGDVLLLADMLEKIQNRCLENYALCPSRYLRIPALSWDAMLSMTKVELDLNLDVNMYLLFEKGMRHIVLYISKRYSQADNQ